MINLGIKTIGLKEAKALLRDIAKQAAFANAKALTATAKDVRDEVTKELPKHLDKPIVFTKRAFGYTSATKRNLKSRVFAKTIQAQYLWWSVEGGVEGDMIQPANVRLNKYGNMPRRKLQTLLARPDVFYATIKGITGVWQRGKYKNTDRFTSQVATFRGARKQTGYRFKAGKFRGIKLLAVREADVTYKTRFDFYGMARRVSDKRWPVHLEEAWALALRTAR